jgi:hypothetical protein
MAGRDTGLGPGSSGLSTAPSREYPMIWMETRTRRKPKMIIRVASRRRPRTRSLSCRNRPAKGALQNNPFNLPSMASYAFGFTAPKGVGDAPRDRKPEVYRKYRLHTQSAKDIKSLTSLRFLAALMILVMGAHAAFPLAWPFRAPNSLVHGVSFFLSCPALSSPRFERSRHEARVHAEAAPALSK